MKSKIKVLIADDHAAFRNSLRAFLEEMEAVEVSGEARNGKQAVEMVERLRPHLIIMDIRMPELDGLSACRIIKERYPEVKVILYSMYDVEIYRKGTDCPSDGLIDKGEVFEKIQDLVKNLSKGIPPGSAGSEEKY